MLTILRLRILRNMWRLLSPLHLLLHVLCIVRMLPWGHLLFLRRLLCVWHMLLGVLVLKVLGMLLRLLLLLLVVQLLVMLWLMWLLPTLGMLMCLLGLLGLLRLCRCSGLLLLLLLLSSKQLGILVRAVSRSSLSCATRRRVHGGLSQIVVPVLENLTRHGTNSILWSVRMSLP